MQLKKTYRAATLAEAQKIQDQLTVQKQVDKVEGKIKK